MNKSQIQTIKKILNEQIIDTQNKIDEYTKLCQPIPPENAIGRVSRMDAINNKSVVEAALKESKDKMHELLQMKIRIKNNDFGNCVKCNNNISYNRLIILPQSKFCVKCAL